jgi:hypothetical protein
MNPRVRKVVEFMQNELDADELKEVAAELAVIAPKIWENYPDIGSSEFYESDLTDEQRQQAATCWCNAHPQKALSGLGPPVTS